MYVKILKKNCSFRRSHSFSILVLCQLPCAATTDNKFNVDLNVYEYIFTTNKHVMYV